MPLFRSLSLVLLGSLVIASAAQAQAGGAYQCEVDGTAPAQITLTSPQDAARYVPVTPEVGGFCGHCAGFTTKAPTLSLTVTDPAPGFVVTLLDQPDTPLSLLVEEVGSDGPLFCLHAVDGERPSFEPFEPQAGQYNFWILAEKDGEHTPVTLLAVAFRPE